MSPINNASFPTEAQGAMSMTMTMTKVIELGVREWGSLSGGFRPPIVNSKTVVWGTFHIHCPAQPPIVAIIIVFVCDTPDQIDLVVFLFLKYSKLFSNLSVVLNCIEYFPVLHVRLKIGTFKMYLSLLLHDSDCMFSRGSSLSWEQKFWAAQGNCGLKWKLQPDVRPQWKFEVQFQPPRIIYRPLLSQTASCTLQLANVRSTNLSSSQTRSQGRSPNFWGAGPDDIRCSHIFCTCLGNSRTSLALTSVL